MYQGAPQINTKKIIEISILIVIILWVIFFIINYFRCTNDEAPILTIHSQGVCDDGTLDIYTGIGYQYRVYNSSSLTKSEFVPIWAPVEQCIVSNGLPQADTEFDIPSNKKRESNYRGLVYFYEDKYNLLGAYKCLNTDSSCTLAVSGYDFYDIDRGDILNYRERIEMTPIFSRYGFVDDSRVQNRKYGDEGYERIIYYYDITNRKILAQFADVKFSTYTRNKYYGTGDKENRIIIKDKETNKWGLVKFKEDGTFENILEYEYESINYNEDSGYYILKNDEGWQIYDIEKDNVLISGIEDPIFDVWENNNMSFYYKTGTRTKIDDKSAYVFNITKFDGSTLVSGKNITSIIRTKHLVMYLSRDDNSLHFIDYTGKEKEEPIKLYFVDFTKDKITHPCLEYSIESNGEAIFVRVYKESGYNSEYETHRINSTRWRYKN